MNRAGAPADKIIARPAGGLEVFEQPATLALHLDDDGREEVLVFDLRGGQLFAYRMEDEEAGFATTNNVGEVIGSWPMARNLRAVSQDIDGDGIDEVMLGAMVPGLFMDRGEGEAVSYRTYDPASGVLGEVVITTWLRAITEPMDNFSMASGQLDLEPGEDVAIVVNYREAADNNVGATRLIIPSGGFDREIFTPGGGPYLAAGIAIADVDADFLGEIVIAGTDEQASIGNYTLLVRIFDDGTSGGFPTIYETSHDETTNNGAATVRIRQTQLHVGRTSVSTATPDLPGPPPPAGFNAFDPADDILINNVLFAFSPVAGITSSTTAEERVSLMAREPRRLLEFGTETELIIDESVQFALGEFDGDGIPDAAVLSEESSIFEDQGMPNSLVVKPAFGGGAAEVLPLARDSGLLRMVPVNVDSDSIVVRYLEEEHVMRYSEPVILAVLAATPCYAGPVGQFTNECSTTFGNTTSSAAAEDSTFGFSMGVTVGFGFEDRTFSQSEIKATASVTAQTSFTTGEETSISFTRSYTNGSPQNQVLATVFGLEQFTYQVLSAPPGAMGEDRVGQRLTISIPRSSVQTTRLFSESLIRPSLRPSQAAAIDEVFDHIPTDPASYNRRADLESYFERLGITGPECDEMTPASELGDCGYLTSRNGIDPGVVSLPGGVMGSGSSAAGDIEVTNATSESNAWGLEESLDLEVSAGGVIFGLSVGASQESSVTVSHGTSVSYGFSAGAVDPAVYSPYQTQVVAFHHTFDCGDNGCQSFEVLNFWAESATP